MNNAYLNRLTRFTSTAAATTHSDVLLEHLGSYAQPSPPRALARAFKVAGYATLLPEVRETVASRELKLGDHASPDVEAFIRDAVTLAAPHTVYTVNRMLATTSRYVTWCLDQGWPLDPETIWSVQALNIYSTTANPDVSEGTRRNYRSLLNRISEVVLPEEHPETYTPLTRKRDTAKPYTAAEMEGFRRWAGEQLTQLKRDRAMLMLTLCAGAGVRSGELQFLRHEDIQVDEHGILVHVEGRQVPLLGEWENWMLVLLERRPTDDILWGPINRRNTSNLTSNFTENSYGKPPRADRLRNTWQTHHLAAGVPMKDFLRATGVEKLQQLHLLLEPIPLRDEDDYRRIFRAVQR